MKDFDAAAFHERLTAAAGAKGWTLHDLGHWPERQRIWLHRNQSEDPARRLYISAGIHGDEHAGPYAALRLIEEDEALRDMDIFLFPLLNPSGLEKDIRENSEGVDLNRDYRDPKTRESLEHIEVLKTLPRFAANICLHEDWEATGFYLYELNPNTQAAYATDIFKAMERYLPAETSPLIDGFEAVAGIISRALGPEIFERLDWPESLYLATHHTEIGYTLETPSKAAPLETRAACLAAGVSALCAQLKKS